MSQPIKLLLVEDNDDDALLMDHALSKDGFLVESRRVETADDLRAALNEPWDVVISDYNIAATFTGLDALKIVQESRRDVPFLIVSGIIGEEKAVECMRAGANDYVMKDPRLARLAPAVRREIQEAGTRRARRLAEERLQDEYSLRETIEKTIPSGIIIADFDGKITYVNPAFCKLVGWSEANLLGSKPPYLFWPPEEANAYLENYWSRVGRGGDVSLELRLLRSDGQDMHVLMLARPLESGSTAQPGWLASFTDITQRKRAERALQELNEQLEKRVEERTHDLNKALIELQQAVADRRRLENELLEIVEKERQRLGLELHDDLGQRLSGLLLMTKGLELKLKKNESPATPDATRIHVNIEEAINLTRGMARNLVLWNFQEGSLVEALKTLAAQFKKLFAVNCTFQAKGDIPPLNAETEMHLYKIAQEATNNGIKHGKAKKVQMQLIREPHQLVLKVTNDGLPFPAVDKRTAGAGLRIMDYRSNRIGASFTIHPLGPKGGTEVTCTLPMPPASNTGASSGPHTQSPPQN